MPEAAQPGSCGSGIRMGQFGPYRGRGRHLYGAGQEKGRGREHFQLSGKSSRAGQTRGQQEGRQEVGPRERWELRPTALMIPTL